MTSKPWRSYSAERAVQEALSERLVDDVAAVEPTIAFPHALVREALIAATGDAARARLHLSIAQALAEEAGAEPAELARHFGLSVELAGPEPAIAAYRAAAAAAAEAHDHEQAISHIRSALSLLPESALAERAAALLELGEQELLCADLARARLSFRAAVEAARATGDVVTLARAALGFAGGDIGFGWEVGTDDPASLELLRRGLEGLGDSEPRLALRMIFRLVYLLVFSDEDEERAGLVGHAEQLGRRLGDPEAAVLAQSTRLIGLFSRSPDPLLAFDHFEAFIPFSGWLKSATATTSCSGACSSLPSATTYSGEWRIAIGRSSRWVRSRSAWVAPASPGRSI